MYLAVCLDDPKTVADSVRYDGRSEPDKGLSLRQAQ